MAYFPNFQQVDVAGANRSAQGYSQNAVLNHMNAFKLGQDVQGAQAKAPLGNAVTAYLRGDTEGYKTNIGDAAKYDPASAMNFMLTREQFEEKKAQGEAAKAERQAKLFDMGLKYMPQFASMVNAGNWANFKQRMGERFGPELASIMPEQYDPNFLKSLSNDEYQFTGDVVINKNTGQIIHDLRRPNENKDPDIIQSLVAAGIDPKSPQGRSIIASYYQRRGGGAAGDGSGGGGGATLTERDRQTLLSGDDASPEYSLVFSHVFSPRVINTDQGPQLYTPPIPPGIRAPKGWTGWGNAAPTQNNAASPTGAGVSGIPGAAPPATAAASPTPVGGTLSGVLPGGEKTPPPMKDEQSKALLFGNRIIDAENVFQDLEKQNWSPSIGQEQVGGIPLIGNMILSPERQKFDQAARNFINASLRRESGAAISESEFENARRQYIPQPGDSRAVLEQKRQNRLQQAKGMESAAGRSLESQLRNISSGKPPQIKNDADFAALAPGTEFIDPQGNLRKKP